MKNKYAWVSAGLLLSYLTTFIIYSVMFIGPLFFDYSNFTLGGSMLAMYFALALLALFFRHLSNYLKKMEKHYNEEEKNKSPD